MTPDEAKLILRMHRADGRHAGPDPLVAEALAQIDRDLALQAWWLKEQALDVAVAAKLDRLEAPAGLRDTILLGARVSRSARAWWRRPTWLAAAAVLAVCLALFSLRRGPSRAPALDLTAFARLALQQLERGPHPHDTTAGATALERELAASSGPIPALAALDVGVLQDHGCRSFTLGGREVFEVCFQRDGTWYHLYVMQRAAGSASPDANAPVFVKQGALAAASWASATSVFALVTQDGPDALRELL